MNNKEEKTIVYIIVFLIVFLIGFLTGFASCKFNVYLSACRTNNIIIKECK